MSTFIITTLSILVVVLAVRLRLLTNTLDKALDLVVRNGEQADQAAALAQIAIHQRDQAQTGVIPGDYFVDPELRELYGPVLDQINSMPPPEHNDQER